MPLVTSVVCYLKLYLTCKIMFEIGVYGEPDRKRPRLESQSSEEEENDNIAFVNMANEIKEDLKNMFRNTRQMALL